MRNEMPFWDTSFFILLDDVNLILENILVENYLLFFPFIKLFIHSEKSSQRFTLKILTKIKSFTLK